MRRGFREPVDASPGPELSAMSLDKQPEAIATSARRSIPRILSCMLALCYRLEMYLRLGRGSSMEAKIPCCGLAKRCVMLKMYRSK